jgi:hypothetical protein
MGALYERRRLLKAETFMENHPCFSQAGKISAKFLALFLPHPDHSALAWEINRFQRPKERIFPRPRCG